MLILHPKNPWVTGMKSGGQWPPARLLKMGWRLPLLKVEDQQPCHITIGEILLGLFLGKERWMEDRHEFLDVSQRELGAQCFKI